MLVPQLYSSYYLISVYLDYTTNRTDTVRVTNKTKRVEILTEKKKSRESKNLLPAKNSTTPLYSTSIPQVKDD